MQNPSIEADMSTEGYKTNRTFWNPKFHYRIPKRLPQVPRLSQINPVHISPSQILKIHLIYIFPPTPTYSKFPLTLRYPHQTPTCTCPVTHMCHTSIPNPYMHLSSHPYVPHVYPKPLHAPVQSTICATHLFQTLTCTCPVTHMCHTSIPNPYMHLSSHPYVPHVYSKRLHAPVQSPICATCLFHTILTDLITRMKSGEQ
jgi:hypothetical protein